MSHPLLRPLEELIEKLRKKSAGYTESDDCADDLERVLRESGLNELLEAGQAMHDEAQGDYETFGAAYKAWDAALAKMKRK